MKLGVTLPLKDVQGDPVTVRDFAQAAEATGYHHLGAPDHVLGVNAASRPDWGERNTSRDFFHDPFVMFGFLSACTSTIEFSTQVVILARRQIVLVAKQGIARCVQAKALRTFRDRARPHAEIRNPVNPPGISLIAFVVILAALPRSTALAISILSARSN